MSKTERISVNITRIVSPTKFWLKLKTDDYYSERNSHVYNNADEQDTYEHRNLTWIKERAEWKCHLAFLGPVDNNAWSLTAIDAFTTHCFKQHEKLAITIPNSITPSTRSTAVILWGSGDRSTIDTDSDALEAEFDVWRNINVKMIFQGLARANVHIEHFNAEKFAPTPNDVQQKMLLPMQNHKNRLDRQGDGKEKTHKKVQRWLPAPPCPNKEFKGIPVCVNKKLEIFVQELESQKLVERISNDLTAWHENRTKNPTKFWRSGDICAALRNSDGKYHRAKVQRLIQKQRKCIVQFVDFGCTELVAFEHLSRHTKFVNVPIQARKCHLSDVIPISEEQTAKAADLCNQLICNQTCILFVHDNIDSIPCESVACSVQPLEMQHDLSSLLISLGLVQYKTHLCGNKGLSVDKFQLEKRMRKKSDKPLQKDSSELLTIDDFEEFFDDNRAEAPVEVAVNTANSIDDDNQMFEIFESPSKRNPLDKTVSVEIQNDADPLVDRITGYFSLLKITESSFYCRPVHIIGSLTVLVQVDDATNLLPTINPVDEQTRYFPLEEFSACIAFHNYTWHRGIVWEKLSTNRYLILFVDTLKISEVNRKLIQTCPTNLLGSKTHFAKVHLGRIKPNARWRARDICDELAANIMHKDLFAKVIGIFDNGTLDVKLYESKDAKRPIYTNLIKNNLYKKIH